MHPDPEVDLFGFGPPALELRQQEQRFHDLPQADPLLLDPLQDAPVFLRSAVAAERDLDLPEQGRQRRAELVRGIAGEPLLPVECLVQAEERLVQPVEQVVEGAPQLVELVAGPGCRQAMAQVGRRHRGRGPGHPGHRRQGAEAEPPPRDRRRCPR